MNADLFTRLTGRQTLRLGNDLFLLESIKNYDVDKSLCVYKLYKFVSNNADEDAPAQRYTSTQSFTATCPTGEIGRSTGTATRVSFISQAAADAAALDAATLIANTTLVCYLPTVTYTSTQTVTVNCSPGYSGPSSTATATATSTISQDDADTQATNTAISDANTGLTCTQDPDPGM
ncbi:DUF5977 domain-containing protein [Hymenobacter siberiensis]|uniref:DUF5977 domain-containing protein n=1 Tax=Hymenobacter siberiensis TaxID=2848396 RepID=UPI001C1E3DA6|nr:hypothetical protein [Hymenobacter siberiensis]